MYKTAFTVVFLESCNKAYNWFNGEFIEFNDLNHPYIKILKENIEKFVRFSYNDSYDDFNWLMDNRFVVETNEIIRKSIKKDLEKKCNSNELSLTLLPSDNACNFRCSYCYEDHSLEKYMNVEEEMAILNFIKKQTPSKVHIEFFGGEPLLNKKFILEFSEKLKQLSKINNFIYSSSMTTNGFLLDISLFKAFLSVNINSYQITIDGLEQDHNSLRPLENGEDSYERIFENLKLIATTDLNFNITIRINFNSKTATKEKRDKVLLKFGKYFGNDRRFYFIFRGIGDYASANNKEINNKKDFLCKTNKVNDLQQLYEEEAIKMGFNVFEMQMYIGNGSASCYAGKRNHLIIDSSLNVKKCTVALDDPVNLVGKIDYSGSFIKNDNWDLWIKDSLFIEKKCSSCFFISQCQSNNCRLKNIKNKRLLCPSGIAVNKKRITNKILNYIETFEGES